MEPRDIQACLRAGIEDRATTVGPFLVLINPHSDNAFRNYAVPVDGAAPTDADVTALIEFFTGRDRAPRLEYVRPAPAVDEPLRAAGFGVTDTLMLMALDGDLAAEPDAAGYHVRLVTAEDDLRQVVAVQDIAYGEAPTEPDPGGLLRTVAAGGCVALAVHTATGAPVGGGLATDPQGGLVEIAAIGVLPEHRGHGVGALVSWALTAESLRRGHQPFLQVERDEPLRVYQRIGYRVIGDMADARR
jgi:GNAT superfamily N-acetyltransferase